MIAVLALCSSLASAAHAEGESQGGAGGGEIWAGVQYGRPPSGERGSTDSSGCRWNYPWEGQQYGTSFEHASREIGGIKHFLWIRSCPDKTSRLWVPGEFSRRDLGASAADRLSRMLPAPEPSSAPPPDKGVTNVGMWFWVAPEAWTPISVTAWVPTPNGILWATATATPAQLIYEPGDGSLGDGPMECAGPGEVWTVADGDDAPSDCMYTYTHASVMDRDGVFSATVSVEWDISWRSSTGGGGQLPSQTTRSTYDVTVRDVQAIVVSV